MTSRISIRPTLALMLGSALLGGCAEMHHGFEAVGRFGSSAIPTSDSTEEVDETPVIHSAVKTVRPRGAARASTYDTSAADPVERPTIIASAVPSPRQIFDFHPAGSAAGSFRQPFVIDPNDGPLAADVRKTATELKAFNAAMKSGTAVASSERCGEMEVVHGKTGCVAPAAKAATASRSASVVQ